MICLSGIVYIMSKYKFCFAFAVATVSQHLIRKSHVVVAIDVVDVGDDGDYRGNSQMRICHSQKSSILLLHVMRKGKKSNR